MCVCVCVCVCMGCLADQNYKGEKERTLENS